MMDKVPKKMNVPINFPGALFSLLDFLNLEAGTARSSQNAAQYLRWAQISNHMVKQAFVRIHIVQF
jgi:hypothetical protein